MSIVGFNHQQIARAMAQAVIEYNEWHIRTCCDTRHTTADVEDGDVMYAVVDHMTAKDYTHPDYWGVNTGELYCEDHLDPNPEHVVKIWAQTIQDGNMSSGRRRVPYAARGVCIAGGWVGHTDIVWWEDINGD